jgi:hypothetical protein
MTREAKLLSGIILITVPTIQYGWYFLLTSLVYRGSGYMENPLRQNFFRAGHAHAGVIVILSLVCQNLADAAVLPSPLELGSFESEFRFQRFLFPRGFLLYATADSYPTQWSYLSDLRRSRHPCHIASQARATLRSSPRAAS